MTGRSKPDGAAMPASDALRSFFDGAPLQLGVSEMTPDQDMLLVSVNPAAAAALGMTVDEVEGKRLSELGLAGPGKGVWLDQYREALSTRSPVRFEQPSGVPGCDRWWDVTLTYLDVGPSGQPRFSYIVQDVTQSRRDHRTQSALFRISEATQSEATLPELFRRIHEIVGELLPARNFFVALHDSAKDELSFPYHVDEFDETPAPRRLDDGTLSGRVIRLGEALLLTPDAPNEAVHMEDVVIGTPSLDWLGVPLKTKSGTIGALVVQSYAGDVRYDEQDKTLLEFVSGQVAAAIERKKAEGSLRLSEARLEEAQRLAHFGSWNFDLVTNTLTWSDELCRLYGVDPASHQPSLEDFLGRVHSGDRRFVSDLVSRVVSTREPFSHETRIVRPDGEVRILFDQGEVLVDAQGSVTGLAGACLDITIRKRAELLEHDRSRILEQVAQNEPLNGVLLHVVETLEHQRPEMRACLLLTKHGKSTGGVCASLPANVFSGLEGPVVAEGRGPFAAARSGLPTLVADITTDDRWTHLQHFCATHEIRCCWSVPILSATGGVLGTLNLMGASPRAATEADRQLLESVCRLAAVAIDHFELTDQLSHQAQHDALTGLPNRLLFQDRLSQALALGRRHKQHVAVIYMDLDRFKHINDTLGHSSGDELLRQTAVRLEGCLRRSDTLARLGGDEFTVVLSDLDNPRDAMHAANKIIEVMRKPFVVEGRELFVTISLGISIFPDDGNDSEVLMGNADAAMYRAKDRGRDNCQWFAAEMHHEARERMEIEGQLRHAIKLDQLSLAYQPQYGPRGESLAFEALMRWQHPTLGEVTPSRFIPIAEDSGLIVPIGEWALRRACAQGAAWRSAGHTTLRMAVNVSAAQFNRRDWVDTVRRSLQDTGLAPEALELEITESLLLQSVRETSANLFELRSMGVGVAIDDFGTGYSSLSYLHQLPISTLKIDQSFVHQIGATTVAGQEDAPIIRTIIALARNLGIAVVAEGVETEAQRELLLRLGCESMQGYLLHRPLNADRACALLDGAETAQVPGATA
ncbi:MAG: EAL domain-containing protein [Lysobacterales bacterium]